jgi:hypothetical protein
VLGCLVLCTRDQVSAHRDDVDDLTGPPFSGQSSALFYHFKVITCFRLMEMRFAAFHSAFVTAHFAVDVKLTTFLAPLFLQHRRTHDQNWSYRQCHRQSVDLGCYSSSILECCLVLWSLWPFLVSSCLVLWIARYTWVMSHVECDMLVLPLLDLCRSFQTSGSKLHEVSHAD